MVIAIDLGYTNGFRCFVKPWRKDFNWCILLNDDEKIKAFVKYNTSRVVDLYMVDVLEGSSQSHQTEDTAINLADDDGNEADSEGDDIEVDLEGNIFFTGDENNEYVASTLENLAAACHSDTSEGGETQEEDPGVIPDHSTIHSQQETVQDEPEGMSEGAHTVHDEEERAHIVHDEEEALHDQTERMNEQQSMDDGEENTAQGDLSESETDDSTDGDYIPSTKKVNGLHVFGGPECDPQTE